MLALVNSKFSCLPMQCYKYFIFNFPFQGRSLSRKNYINTAASARRWQAWMRRWIFLSGWSWDLCVAFEFQLKSPLWPLGVLWRISSPDFNYLIFHQRCSGKETVEFPWAEKIQQTFHLLKKRRKKGAHCQVEGGWSLWTLWKSLGNAQKT